MCVLYIKYINMAQLIEKKYFPFELSDFQKKAVQAIDNNKHPFVLAPTGNGKTVPAEYSIQKFCRNGKKVIYTVPIKALANEKLEDFKEKYSDISFGIVTGDNSNNSTADCLIMTTEILWKTIYQQRMIKKNYELKDKIKLHFEFDIQEEVAAVVFDEVHMINDKYRGTVYEETIKELPDNVIKIMLSATIGNSEIFEKWLENVVICRTDKRIVPLHHHLFLSVPDSFNKKIYDKKIKNKILNCQNKPLLIKREGLHFQDEVYHSIDTIQSYINQNKLFINRTFALNKLIQYLFDNDLLPSVCFVFSKKLLEKYAHSVSINLHGNDSIKTSIVEKECKKILSSKLVNYKEYIELPEYKQLLKLFEKGIGIHHSDMLQIFRELVEKLFKAGFIKLLFATETFTKGINMPNRSVIYTSMSKWDGHFRPFKSHEYMQGSGRAGRRGLDTKGMVFHLVNMFDLPHITEYRQILSNKPENISSQLRLDSNLILKLLSTRISIEDFVKNSLYDFSLKMELKYSVEEYNKLSDVYNKKSESCKYNITKPDILNNYVELNEKVKLCSRKQKKRFEREISNLEQEYKNIVKEYNKYLEIQKVKDEINNIQKHISNLETHYQNVFDNILHHLISENFLNNNLELTTKGHIACNINQINCLVLSEMISDGLFDNIDTKDILCVLSCLTNCKVSDNDRIISLKTVDIPENVKDIINKSEKIYYKYEEDSQNFHYELCEILYEWIDVSNTQEANILFEKCRNKDISIGKFTKYILTIMNIIKEIGRTCLLYNKIDLIHKLYNTGSMLLKSIVTNRSLYL